MITPGAASQTPALARDAATVVILLERFGDLLTEALDAAGRGADEDFAVAIAERTRVTTALGTRLAALAVARQVARRDGVTEAEIDAALRPVDDALRHAQLLHDRIAEDVPTPVPGRPVLSLVR
ncbi:MAG TPA: hypothetical protein VGD56_04210 [Gemmatirosa sp.]